MGDGDGANEHREKKTQVNGTEELDSHPACQRGKPMEAARREHSPKLQRGKRDGEAVDKLGMPVLRKRRERKSEQKSGRTSAKPAESELTRRINRTEIREQISAQKPYIKGYFAWTTRKTRQGVKKDRSEMIVAEGERVGKRKEEPWRPQQRLLTNDPTIDVLENDAVKARIAKIAGYGLKIMRRSEEIAENAYEREDNDEPLSPRMVDSLRRALGHRLTIHWIFSPWEMPDRRWRAPSAPTAQRARAPR